MTSLAVIRQAEPADALTLSEDSLLRRALAARRGDGNAPWVTGCLPGLEWAEGEDPLVLIAGKLLPDKKRVGFSPVLYAIKRKGSHWERSVLLAVVRDKRGRPAWRVQWRDWRKSNAPRKITYRGRDLDAAIQALEEAGHHHPTQTYALTGSSIPPSRLQVLQHLQGIFESDDPQAYVNRVCDPADRMKYYQR
jgi:hypothetical protein